MTHNPAEALREALGLGKKFDMEEALARAIFNDQHQGLQNCYDWDTAGLEDEHPGTTELYRGYAQSAIKTLAAALTSPVPAGGEATPNETTLITIIADIREKSGVGSKPMLSELADAIAERITPPPSPDVAGVKLADRVDLTGGVRPAHVLESLTESVNQAWAIIGDNARCSVPATFIGWLLQEYESLSAEKGRMEEALREAGRFIEYFAGETDNTFVGPGTPKACLEQIRALTGEEVNGRR